MDEVAEDVFFVWLVLLALLPPVDNSDLPTRCSTCCTLRLHHCQRVSRSNVRSVALISLARPVSHHQHHQHHQHPHCNSKGDYPWASMFPTLFPSREEHIPHFGRRALSQRALNFVRTICLCPRLISPPFTERMAIGHSLLAAVQDGQSLFPPS